MESKLEALAQAGKHEIDVFAPSTVYLPGILGKDLAEDLTGQVTIPEAIPGNLYEELMFDGKVTVVPIRPNVQTNYYNENKLNEYGLTPPKNWDELLDFATPEQRFNHIEDFIDRLLTLNPKTTQSEIYGKIRKQHAYIKKGVIYFNGQSRPLKPFMAEAIDRNNRIAWVEKFKPFTEAERDFQGEPSRPCFPLVGTDNCLCGCRQPPPCYF